MGKKYSLGVTLIELLVSVGILVAVSSVLAVGIRFVNSLLRQKAASEIEQNAQLVLYEMTRDIRNAKSIVSITGDTLVINSFNFNLGYDVSISSAILQSVNIGTITFQFTQSGNNSWVERDILFNNRTQSMRFLQNILEPDDPKTTSIVESIFSPVPDTAVPPYE